MKKTWTAMKNIIQAVNRPGDVFLSLINEDGVITCANAAMIKELEIQHPRAGETNFFDLVHPTHLQRFKSVVGNATSAQNPQSIELYIKNGHYHPMKWHVNYLKEDDSSKKTYLCLGYNILDQERLRKFNNLVKQNYQLLIENLTGIIFHDVNGDVVATNQKTASIFETNLERLYGIKNTQYYWDNKWYITDENGERMFYDNTPFMKAVRTGKTQQETLVVLLPSGEEKWILYNSQPLPETETGGDFSVISSIIDVTSERKLSMRLKERESLIHSFLQQTTQLAWVVDEEATLLFASRAFYQHFGLDEKKSLNKNVFDIVPNNVIHSVLDQHRKVLETGKPVETTKKVRWADGNNNIAYINLFPLGTQGGRRLLGGQAIHLPDNSDLERKLHHTQERLLNLKRATSDAIWEWDMQTGVMTQNEVLSTMIGYQRNKTRGLAWWLRQIHPEDRNRIADKLRESIECNQQSWTDEYRFKCADNSYKHIQHKGFVVYENGLPVKMIGSLNDVSELKSLENKLADERIRRQKEISETVVRAQEVERTRIGHELHDNVNQLLSATKLFVDFLVPHGKEQMQVKQKSIEYIQRTIDEIRKLSKELVAPQLKEKGLNDSIRGLVEDIEMVDALRVRFIHDMQADLLSSGKRVTIFRIVQEQLKNILKHSKAHNTVISLQTRNDELELVITDDGIGFDPQQTQRGIGISNIRERVNFYNGKVEIEAAAGKGCTLKVLIPVND